MRTAHGAAAMLATSVPADSGVATVAGVVGIAVHVHDITGEPGRRLVEEPVRLRRLGLPDGGVHLSPTVQDIALRTAERIGAIAAQGDI